ncbi:molybdenum cofactor biosynthesis protein 1-like protein [Protomyces lactucae-debilis]|uniref:Molybdenum cofactor biosynthesis protein 1 n=1 Tax=Protomyces lactucae-debilis TaxID=2754530 RepID=A0A1Y2F1M8_PROLT|nr:molybdenum cofactor biosynthesis protein 1-like protein [Protomyces lactucae-debilis]ORY77769.1 molybdenum cofactor biosynthesis protein 1-like protein [Protomyces lactucae-debilis]
MKVLARMAVSTRPARVCRLSWTPAPNRCRTARSHTSASHARYTADAPIQSMDLPRAQQSARIKSYQPFSDFLTDTHARQHDYLRISITEKCNLRCTYCMPEEGVELQPEEKLLSTDEILRVARVFVSQGVTKIRLTGGEPTVRKDIIQLVERLGELRSLGLKEIAMTSNGIALKRKLPALVAAGLTHLNLSLDTLDPLQYELLARRRGLDAVLSCIDQAIALGIQPLKVNCVVINRINDREITDFVEFTRTRPIEVRFIEYMPFDGNRWNKEKMVPYADMLARIRMQFPTFSKVQDAKNDTAKVWQVPGFLGKVGFITSMTNHFCGSCNRLRITSDGNLKVCLFGNTEVSLRDMMRSTNDDAALLEVIGAAVKRKKKQHAGLTELETMKNRPMILIDRKVLWTSMSASMPWLAGKYTTKQARYYSSKTPKLTHVDELGAAHMVDVGQKTATRRVARVVAQVQTSAEAIQLIVSNMVKKGDVLATARIAGIMAAKQTSALIPLCHNINLSKVKVHLQVDEATSRVLIDTEAICDGVTGVEMEALTACSVAALTVYDMLKAVDKRMVISGLRVVEKQGGKSGDWSI